MSKDVKYKKIKYLKRVSYLTGIILFVLMMIVPFIDPLLRLDLSKIIPFSLIFILIPVFLCIGVLTSLYIYFEK